MQKKEIPELKIYSTSKIMYRIVVILMFTGLLYVVTQQIAENYSVMESNSAPGYLDYIYIYCLILFLILIGLIWAKIAGDYKILKQRGIITNARITKTLSLKRILKQTIHTIYYEYVDSSGRLHKHHTSMYEKALKKMQEYGYIQGDKIEIIYDPIKPKRVYLSVNI